MARTPPAVYEARALRMQADAGDPDAARQMLGLLVEHGLVDELRAEVDAGVEFAVERLIAVLARPRRDS